MKRTRMYKIPEGAVCLVDDCDGPMKSRAYCNKHYLRFNKYGDPLAGGKFRAASGSGWIDDRGYKYISVDGQVYLEHRYIMEQILNRKLYDGETVHHKNGIREDNEPNNLELWVTAQPYGQRVEDVLAWAKEIIERYEKYPLTE